MTLTAARAGYAAPRLDPPSAGNIALALERLGTVGTVLYVAAHPDDENTRLLAWLAKGRGLRAAYLSMTRGDGGQNLVGPELGPLLGLIRTHELMAARGIDGAEQYFTRAIDFGYSKSAAETLATWGKDEVLADVVRVVRLTRPDVIITRFSLDPPNHGHHTASAMLAQEAFSAAADPSRFPDQLGPAGLTPHQALRLFENKSTWRLKEGEDLTRYLAIDVGGLSPMLGRAYPELAADSRTMHKSQGFGSAPTHGKQLEYFQPVLAERWPASPRPAPEALSDPLAGIDFSWARFPGTDTLRKRLAEANRALDPHHPERLLPSLYKVHAAMTALPDDNPWKAEKLAQLDELMLACAGVMLDARAKTPVAIPGEPLALTATALARLQSASVAVTWPDGAASEARQLDMNVLDLRAATVTVKGAYSTPFWLAHPHPEGLYAPAPESRGVLPVGPPELTVGFRVQLGPVAITTTRPVRYGWVDPVHGERFRPVELLPPVTVTPLMPIRMFPSAPAQKPAARPLELRVRAHGAARAGEVRLVAPSGWTVSPPARPFQLDAEGEVTVTFDVTPNNTTPVALSAHALVGGATHDLAEVVIDHLHIPRTTVLSPARVRAVPLELATGGTRIGYIAGAGDDVPAGLAQVGYDVTVLDPKALDRTDLTAFSAIIAGIRAYNVAPELRHAHPALMRYVAGGGTYLVQYVTSTRQRQIGDMPIGPFPFVIDRDRVTDQRADMRLLDPKHPAVTTPNRLGPEDFAGWAQERGLYFAATWDEHYTPLFASHDPGEAPLEGAVIVARHGKGAFVYTGLSFFRQLPEGVPGAYRLLANLLALGAPR